MSKTDKSGGYFMKPQNFSVNDGDGIRTIIFFAGCPLRCRWCSNPESFFPQTKKNEFVDFYTIYQIIEIIEKQRIFYRNSGGGVTFSGGECTFQHDILRSLTDILYDKAIDMAIETSGYFCFDEIKDILEKLDLIFIDIKHMDDEKHRMYTGKSNKLILENIKRIAGLNIPVVVRIPVIDGFNSDIENIIKTAKFVKSIFEHPQIELLPFHSLAQGKYETLGLQKPSQQFKTPSKDYIEKLKKEIANQGVKIVSYL